jgi:hypothetical protein
VVRTSDKMLQKPSQRPSDDNLACKAHQGELRLRLVEGREKQPKYLRGGSASLSTPGLRPDPLKRFQVDMLRRR